MEKREICGADKIHMLTMEVSESTGHILLIGCKYFYQTTKLEL